MDAKLNPELHARKQRLYADRREQWFVMRAEKPLIKGQQVCQPASQPASQPTSKPFGVLLSSSSYPSEIVRLLWNV